MWYAELSAFDFYMTLSELYKNKKFFLIVIKAKKASENKEEKKNSCREMKITNSIILMENIGWKICSMFCSVYRNAEEAFFHHSRVLHSSFFFSSQIAFHYNSTIFLILLFSLSLTRISWVKSLLLQDAVRAQSWVLISFSILML